MLEHALPEALENTLPGIVPGALESALPEALENTLPEAVHDVFEDVVENIPNAIENAIRQDRERNPTMTEADIGDIMNRVLDNRANGGSGQSSATTHMRPQPSAQVLTKSTEDLEKAGREAQESLIHRGAERLGSIEGQSEHIEPRFSLTPADASQFVQQPPFDLAADHQIRQQMQEKINNHILNSGNFRGTQRRAFGMSMKGYNRQGVTEEQLLAAGNLVSYTASL